MALTIQVHERVNFTPKEVAKHKQACIEAEKVLASKRFKDKFLEKKLTNNLGHSNIKIYEMLQSGSDNFNKEVDSDIDVYVEMYYKNNKVVGYTTPSINKTYLNRKYFTGYDAADVACNLVHEYLHKVKFDHKSASEHTSVPYAIGYLVEECIREMWKNPGLYDESATALELPVETPIEYPEKNDIPVEAKKLICKRLWYTFWTKKICWFE